MRHSVRPAVVMIALAACGGRSDPSPIALPVEIAQSVDPRLVVEVREATYSPSYLHVLGLVTNRGDVTYTDVNVHVELLDASGAIVGGLDIQPVGFDLSKLGWLYAGFQVPVWNSTVWSGEWKPPTKLRVRVTTAEVQAGTPPPAQPVLKDPPLRVIKPAPPPTRLAIQMVWGGGLGEGTGPSAGITPFDVELALTNAGTTTIEGAELHVVFEDAAGKEIERLGIDAGFSPPMRPGDRRLVGNAHGVHSYARWYVEVGEIRIASEGPSR